MRRGILSFLQICLSLYEGACLWEMVVLLTRDSESERRECIEKEGGRGEERDGGCYIGGGFSKQGTTLACHHCSWETSKTGLCSQVSPGASPMFHANGPPLRRGRGDAGPSCSALGSRGGGRPGGCMGGILPCRRGACRTRAPRCLVRGVVRRRPVGLVLTGLLGRSLGGLGRGCAARSARGFSWGCIADNGLQICELVYSRRREELLRMRRFCAVTLCEGLVS